ncbi:MULTISPECIES: methyltransferase domain-containing protein [unclassified Viridibacillus]|uniref:TRM11 family SAM-dependent methyltransferase n=2 Tax=unclassified Viridibacillus TaxID=2617942 RepID=UPI00096FC107|nr:MULTISPECIES: methyltransferase domain-containing protein [unclassified Viridibacillus]OMC83510.1 RNA methyltransferase [Viridibacillus sp. FSL H8-0123]OMC84494.1 RNA methyltransferase [Viridibacillus sp. FSL H7-0596]
MSNREFIYTYSGHKDEYDLCRMEMRSFFGFDVLSNVLKSTIEIDPSRSPFMKERLEVIYEGESFEQIADLVEQLDLDYATFKVVCLNDSELGSMKKVGHSKRREIERNIGLRIKGEPDLDQPETVFGVVMIDNKWYFGKLEVSEPIWLHHQQKPHMYSTALNTRVARAVANIAVPHPNGVRAIDPCCGIGTVLVEALSMGIDIVGRDINRRVVLGSRKNIAHFGLEGNVTTGPISEIEDNYDVAIIDMPYNLFTHITVEEQLDIVKQARRFTKKVVIVTIDTMDHMIEEAGFEIIDRCEARKGTFSRQVLVCK